MSAALCAKFAAKDATIGVVGLGYVGLPLLVQLAQAGFVALGFDTDAKKVRDLKGGVSYLRQIDGATLAALSQRQKLYATTDVAALGGCDAVLICVPTPLTRQREPDTRYIEATCRALAPHLRPGMLVVLESTTYPGCTEELVRPLLEASTPLVAGVDFHLAFSPERSDPGHDVAEAAAVPKLVGGLSAACAAAAAALYGAVFAQVVPLSSPRTAEMAKLLENIFRSVNIALVNELKMLCHAMDIDVWEVIAAASSKPFGFMPFFPGPGPGGHCIPVDPFYLAWKAREYGVATRFIELAGEINAQMPHYVVARTALGLNAQARAVRGSQILILGIAYKRDVDDLREAPALSIIEQLQAQGAAVSYHDPLVPHIPALRQHALHLSSVPLEDLQRFDAAVIVTDHSGVDYGAVLDAVAVVVDVRNVTRGLARPEAAARVVQA